MGAGVAVVISLVPMPTNLGFLGLSGLAKLCLERLILFGEGSWRKAVQEFLSHYHLERNHQGLGNRLILPAGIRQRTTGLVRRRQRLGGMHTHTEPRVAVDVASKILLLGDSRTSSRHSSHEFGLTPPVLHQRSIFRTKRGSMCSNGTHTRISLWLCSAPR